MKTIVNNQSIKAMENTINKFAERLILGEYKVILYNNQGAYTADDIESLADTIIYYLNEESSVELKGNVMIIHTEVETIELKGRKRMSDGEIFARKYLEECGDDLVIKDDEMQIEMKEENFKNAKDFYKKCKDIINIRGFFGYDEESSIYKMNWDAFWMSYKDGSRELWQRM